MASTSSRPAAQTASSQLSDVGTKTVAVNIRPDQRLQFELDSHPPGTTFVLNEGIYRLSSPLVLKDRQQLIGRGQVVLTGAKTLERFQRAGSVWTIGGQTQEGRVVERAAEVCLFAAPRCNRPEDLFVDNRVLRHVASLDDLRPGAWYFDYDADRIVMFDDPTGHTVETSVTPFAVVGDADGVTLRGLIVEKFATPTHEAAIDGRLTGLHVEQVDARFNHFAGIGTLGGATARNNRVHENGALGFIGSGDDIVIDHNEIDHNGTVGYDPYWAAGGTKWVYTKHLVVTNNDVHDNHGPGLWTDINNIDVLVDGNRVYDNDLSGIFHEVGYRAVIRHNIVSGNGRVTPFPGWVVGAGILVSSSSDVEVYSNDLTDNWQGIAGLEDERGPGLYGPWVLARLYVHDNSIRQTVRSEPGSGRSGVAQVHDGTSAFAAGLNRFVNNTYALTGAGLSFFWMGRDMTDAEWRRVPQDVTGRITRSDAHPHTP